VNVAVTDAAAVRLTVHESAVPVQPPPQPAKVEPVDGDAVRVMVLPTSKVLAHVAPHEMPVGKDVTVPEPVPIVVTASVAPLLVNVAVTAVVAVTSTMHEPMPVQAPLQPPKVEF
jgi:hypothetical protein